MTMRRKTKEFRVKSVTALSYFLYVGWVLGSNTGLTEEKPEIRSLSYRRDTVDLDLFVPFLCLFCPV
jgi:hypothetical protein